MRKLIYGMNLTLDGYIAAPGDDLGWSEPSDELFQWWLDQERPARPPYASARLRCDPISRNARPQNCR